jgi:hypothetical protein
MTSITSRLNRRFFDARRRYLPLTSSREISMSSPAGWYPQPDGRQRYWDGELWTEQFAPDVLMPSPDTTDARSAFMSAGTGTRRFGSADACGWGGLAIVIIIGALSSGFSGAAMMFGLFALVVALLTLARGRVGWARLGSRAAGGAALGAALVLITVGALAAPPITPAPVVAVAPLPSPPAPTTTTPEVSVSPTATTVAAPTTALTAAPTIDPAVTAVTQARSGTPLAAVAILTVRGALRKPATAVPSSVRPGSTPTATAATRATTSCAATCRADR